MRLVKIWITFTDSIHNSIAGRFQRRAGINKKHFNRLRKRVVKPVNCATRNKHGVTLFHFNLFFIYAAYSFSGKDIDNFLGIFVNVFLVR